METLSRPPLADATARIQEHTTNTSVGAESKSEGKRCEQVQPTESPSQFDTAEGLPQHAEGGTLAFVDFCRSCFGACSRKKAGDKLGIMGGATVVEMPTVLEYLENWAGRSIAKVKADMIPFKDPVLSALAGGSDFVVTLLSYTGKSSLEELYQCFPSDAAGRFDLPAMFGVEGGSTTSAAGFDADFTKDGFTSSYVENPADLLPADEDLRHRAECHLLEGDAAESHWDANGAAINIVRSSIFSGTYEGADVSPSAPLLAAIAQHSISRRPTLAKSALNAIIELASTYGPSKPWAEAHVFGHLLGAVKTTKLVLRNAEAALEAVVELFIEDKAVELAACELCSALGNSVHPKPHPQAVTIGLKALSRLAAVISPAESEASIEIRGICDKVISNRVLGSTFAAARAVLKSLDSTSVTVASHVASKSNQPARSGAAKALHRQQATSDVNSGYPATKSSVHALLSQQWCEVQYLLRDGPGALSGESECANTERAAENSLKFLQRLESTAARMGVRKGALSRQLLPFNLETDARDQANVGGELESGKLEGFLPGEQEEMVADALALRRLIRVKIADCADVSTAQASLRLLLAFTSGLLKAAHEENCDVASLLRAL